MEAGFLDGGEVCSSKSKPGWENGPAENLLEDTGGLLRPPFASSEGDAAIHQRHLDAVACCFRFLLMCALLVTSSHWKAG